MKVTGFVQHWGLHTVLEHRAGPQSRDCPLVIQVVRGVGLGRPAIGGFPFSRRSFLTGVVGVPLTGGFRHGLCGGPLGCSRGRRPGVPVVQGWLGKPPDRSGTLGRTRPVAGTQQGNRYLPSRNPKRAVWHQTARRDGWHSPWSVIRFQLEPGLTHR